MNTQDTTTACEEEDRTVLWFGIDAAGQVHHSYGEWPIDGCQREYRLGKEQPQ